MQSMYYIGLDVQGTRKEIFTSGVPKHIRVLRHPATEVT